MAAGDLQFDQFEVALDLQITGTLAAHSLITNGAVTVVGARHWQVTFPGWFSSLSPLLELRPSNTVESATGSVTLPVSGTDCSLEAWKLTGGPDNLTTRLSQLEQLLVANENDYGPMLGNRFVLFFNDGSGGMEYAGATTTSSGAMGHEVFHWWFARGIFPAGQSDGWWDEGFTVWHDAGADDTEPFDFLEPPVALCSRQPFQRRTPGTSYSAGSRFFRGAAAMAGVTDLNAAMRGTYASHRGDPVSTGTSRPTWSPGLVSGASSMLSTASSSASPTPVLPHACGCRTILATPAATCGTVPSGTPPTCGSAIRTTAVSCTNRPSSVRTTGSTRACEMMRPAGPAATSW